MTTVPLPDIAVIGAPSNIGIKPYDNAAEPRGLDRAPGVLRELGLVARLAGDDLGDATPPPYRDFTRPPNGVRNELEVAQYCRALGDRVAAGMEGGRFALVLGGDCSIVLGSLLGATRRALRTGLAYIDAHADFATPQESLTGSAASMCLALAVGRGDSPLARLGGSSPLVRGQDVVLIGRRDVGQASYGHAALGSSGILDLRTPIRTGTAAGALAAGALERLASPDLDGFWIHVDADVLDPRVMAAVDSPEAGGPGLDDLAALVAPLARHPKALGMQLTIYDPALDPGRACAGRLVDLLVKILANGSTGAHR